MPFNVAVKFTIAFEMGFWLESFSVADNVICWLMFAEVGTLRVRLVLMREAVDTVVVAVAFEGSSFASPKNWASIV